MKWTLSMESYEKYFPQKDLKSKFYSKDHLIVEFIENNNIATVTLI